MLSASNNQTTTSKTQANSRNAEYATMKAKKIMDMKAKEKLSK